MPLRRHETICIFYKNLPKYNPIMEVRGIPREKGRREDVIADGTSCYGSHKAIQHNKNNEYYPTSILQFSNGNHKGRIHSTQKPIKLMEWPILTYTDVGDLVVDNCAGSCSVGIAAHNTGRRFIGFEKDKRIYTLANKCLQEHKAQLTIFDFMKGGEKE